MSIRTEINLRLPNSPGALAGICELLAAEHVDIVALSVEASGQVRLVVDNHVHAASVLREQHHQVAERHVIVTAVGTGPGTLSPVLRLVADAGINIEYAYGSAAQGAGNPGAAIVIGVADAQRAAAAAGI
jgi:hypothetical protein